MPEREERSGRETRLLALVIVVALAALLMLARFRFPAADLADVRPAQGPLERLVARSTYEDLAASVANLVQRVSSAVVVLQIQSLAPDPATGARGVAPEPPPAVTRLVPGARMAGDLALVHVPSGFQVTGGQGLAVPVEVLRADQDLELALVRAPSVLEITSVLANPFEGFPGFSYVGVVEAAIGGVTAKPTGPPTRGGPIPSSSWAGRPICRRARWSSPWTDASSASPCRSTPTTARSCPPRPCRL